MAADQTFNTTYVNEVGPTLSLTTTEKEYDIVKTLGSGNPPDATVIFKCDAAWLVGSVTGGPYQSVAAGESYVVLPQTAITKVWVKTASGTGTLRCNRL